MTARQIIEAEDPKRFMQRLMPRPWHVIFLKDTCQPWDYAQYDVDALDEKSAFLAGRAKLVAEVGPRRARQWKDHAATIAHRRHEAEDPKKFLRQQAPPPNVDWIIKKIGQCNVAVPVSPEARAWAADTLPERRRHGGFWPAMPEAVVIYDEEATLTNLSDEGWRFKVE